LTKLSKKRKGRNSLNYTEMYLTAEKTKVIILIDRLNWMQRLRKLKALQEG
jgi:hypothetical protein